MYQAATAIHKWLSRAGIMSRSDAQAAVRAGRVLIDGQTATSGEDLVLPGSTVLVDGHRVERHRRLVLAMHKPAGVMTTHRDPQGRPTVYHLLDSAGPWLAPIGRLDYDSEGLILLTNDPQLGAALTDPARGVDKIYLVTSKGPVSDESLRLLENGVILHGESKPTRPAHIDLLSRTRDRTTLQITVHEGKKRQIRRMLKAVGSHVRRLVRVQIGPLALGTLAVGQSRLLTDGEIAELAQAARHQLREES